MDGVANLVGKPCGLLRELGLDCSRGRGVGHRAPATTGSLEISGLDGDQKLVGGAFRVTVGPFRLDERHQGPNGEREQSHGGQDRGEPEVDKSEPHTYNIGQFLAGPKPGPLALTPSASRTRTPGLVLANGPSRMVCLTDIDRISQS
jgi:hypothetical protein